MQYTVYATVTGKINLGEYEAENRIEAAKKAIADKRVFIRADLCETGLYEVEIVPYDCEEVEE